MEMPAFDLSLPKLLVLAALALTMFGRHELPNFAAQAGRAVRDLRRIADGAKTDLREGLSPEFSDFDLDELNPPLRPKASAQRPKPGRPWQD
jgi:sec-independent protein translocase protein TatB